MTNKRIIAMGPALGAPYGTDHDYHAHENDPLWTALKGRPEAGPVMMVSTPSGLNVARFRELWEAAARGRPLILDAGVKIESREWTRDQITKVFRLLPHLLGDPFCIAREHRYMLRASRQLKPGKYRHLLRRTHVD